MSCRFSLLKGISLCCLWTLRNLKTFTESPERLYISTLKRGSGRKWYQALWLLPEYILTMRNFTLSLNDCFKITCPILEPVSNLLTVMSPSESWLLNHASSLHDWWMVTLPRGLSRSQLKQRAKVTKEGSRWALASPFSKEPSVQWELPLAWLYNW